MTTHRGLSLYRRLLVCYPRAFRDQYGSDMVLLMSNQLDDEPPLRVWVRGVVDLAVTVPSRHVEVHMHRPPSNIAPLIFGGIATAGCLMALLAGTNGAVVLGAVIFAAAAAVLAVVSARHSHAVTSPSSPTAHWWKLIVLGAAGLAAMIAAAGATDLSLWFPMVLTILSSFVMIAGGVVLGIARLVTAGTRHASG
jgi:hypothetical protein